MKTPLRLFLSGLASTLMNKTALREFANFSRIVAHLKLSRLNISFLPGLGTKLQAKLIPLRATYVTRWNE